MNTDMIKNGFNKISSSRITPIAGLAMLGFLALQSSVLFTVVAVACLLPIITKKR